MTAAPMTVRDAVLNLLRDFGMRRIFGNPGSTELPLFLDFPADFEYVLGLQESVVVGMADGYASATRNAAFVNLHSAVGVGHAMGAIFTAWKNRTPLVITAGLLSAQVVDNNAGHGSFSVPYLGDLLQGESTRVDASYAAFGTVYQQVLGPSPRSFTGRRGIANAHGARGVNAQCEYVLTGPGAGTGVCRFSDGANYQMHFGG